MVNSHKDGATKTNFIIYFVSRLISDLGSSIFSFALSLYVLDVTGSAALFTIIVGFSYLPKTIVNIAAGVYVDKHDKKKLVILFDFISGIATLIFWMIFKTHAKSIPLITGFQIVLSALVGMFVLALNSSIPNLSTKENVVKFNSMSMGITAVVSMGGPVIGAIAYKAFGIFGVTFIDGITFFISGAMEVFLKYNKTVANKDGKSYFESFRTVWAYLNGEKILKNMLFIIVILNCIMTPMVTVVLQYVNYHELKVSGSQLSLIQASWSLGIIIGAVFVSTRKSIYGLLRKFLIFIQIQSVMIILWFIFKLPYFTKPGSASLKITAAFCIIMLVAGLFNGFSSISAMSFIQTDTPEDILAGIVGVVNACQIAVPVGMWIYGILLEKVPWVYDTVISGVLLFSIAGFVNLKINLKDYFMHKESKNVSVSKESSF